MEPRHLEQSLAKFNQVVSPFKERLAKNDRKMYLYLLAGLLGVLTLAILLGVAVHFAIAIVLILAYLGGLIYIVRKF